jgi:hyperosmotically inducible periplasmic protein
MRFGATGGPNIKRVRLVLATLMLLSGSYMSAAAQNATPVAPNNSGINVRDRPADAMTAGEQPNAKGDVQLTARIRRAIVKDKSLSTMAHNIKIISSNGGVILRGPVKTTEEKQTIEEKAAAIAGADKVNNQLEIEGQ